MPVPTSRSAPAIPRWRAFQLGQLDRIPLDGGSSWRPVRRTLDVTAFGVNAYTAGAVDDELIEHHDETSSGAGGHEELYVVLTGHARFIVDGTAVDAPAGTLILIEPGIARSATAQETETTVLVVGGRPGAALPASPFEHWYAAEGAYRDGDFERATQIASAGLVDWPDHPHLAINSPATGRWPTTLRVRSTTSRSLQPATRASQTGPPPTLTWTQSATTRGSRTRPSSAAVVLATCVTPANGRSGSVRDPATLMPHRTTWRPCAP